MTDHDRPRMIMIRRWLLVLLLLVTATARAETARQVLDDLRKVNEARDPKDFAATVRVTHFRAGEVRFVRELRNYSKRYRDGRSKALAVFLSPFDVRGVRFLAWEEPSKSALQWLYLPNLNRARQITSAQRGQSFQGSAFSYEDVELLERIRDWTEADAASRLLEEGDAIDGVPCAMVELTPKRPEVSYGRIVVWIRREDATLRQADLYARDGRLTKQVRFGGFHELDGVPIPYRSEIKDFTAGERTVVETLEATVNPGLDEGLFEPAGLDHASGP